jgi:hypothetical protein
MLPNMGACSFSRCEPAHTKVADGQFSLRAELEGPRDRSNFGSRFLDQQRGTQLILELIHEGSHGVGRYHPTLDACAPVAAVLVPILRREVRRQKRATGAPRSGKATGAGGAGT